ncbi:MAG: hypothetical protein AB1744_14120, partial [Candidatus Zixiibacteriota bacterium]
MEKAATDKRTLIVVVTSMALFVIAQLVGDSLFANNWSFRQWTYLSHWYVVLWLVMAVAVCILVVRFRRRIGAFFGSRLKVFVGLLALFALLFLFQFDSFLYGGGNLRVAQVGQVERVILRWFEYGSVLIVSTLDSFFDLFDLHYNTAAVYAWKTFSFACVVLSMLGAIKLAQQLSPDRPRRFFLFLILFFGPHTLLLFGFVGLEPVVVTVSIWFALIALRLMNRFRPGHLTLLWLLVVFGTFMHYTLLYLLPAAVYVTVRGRRKTGTRPLVAVIVGGLVWILLLIVIYVFAAQNLEFKTFVLLLDGKLPHSDYSVFSGRHVGDVVQL